MQLHVSIHNTNPLLLSDDTSQITKIKFSVWTLTLFVNLIYLSHFVDFFNSYTLITGRTGLVVYRIAARPSLSPALPFPLSIVF